MPDQQDLDAFSRQAFKQVERAGDINIYLFGVICAFAIAEVDHFDRNIKELNGALDPSMLTSTVTSCSPMITMPS